MNAIIAAILQSEPRDYVMRIDAATYLVSVMTFDPVDCLSLSTSVLSSR
jgi:hypothetical protein